MSLFVEDPLHEASRLRRSMDRMLGNYEPSLYELEAPMQYEPFIHAHVGLPLWSALIAPLPEVHVPEHMQQQQQQQQQHAGIEQAGGSSAAGGNGGPVSAQQQQQQKQRGGHVQHEKRPQQLTNLVSHARKANRALTMFVPNLDISELDKEFVLRADVPGCTRDSIKISVKDNVLTLSGERKEQSHEAQESVRRLERRYGSFSRSLQLPVSVDTNGITASYENGVLTLHLPKNKNAVARDIKIN